MAIASFVSRAHSRERVQINSQGRHWFDFRRSCVGRATGETKEPDCGPVPQRVESEDRPRPSVADRAGAPSMSKAGNALPDAPRLLPRTLADGDAHRRGEKGEPDQSGHKGTIPEGLRPRATTTGKRQIRRSAKGVGCHRHPARSLGLQPRVRATRIGFLAKRVPAAQRATRRILRATGPGSTAFRRGVQKAARLAVPLCGKPFSCGRRGG